MESGDAPRRIHGHRDDVTRRHDAEGNASGPGPQAYVIQDMANKQRAEVAGVEG